MESGRRGLQNVSMKVFVGTNSLFRRICILLTTDTPWEERFSIISSSLTPSKSLDRMTPLEELRDVCALTLIGILHLTFDFRRHLEWCLLHSSSKRPLLILFTLFSSPAKHWSAFWIANGDKEFNAHSLTGSIIKNLGQLSLDILEIFLWIPHLTLRNPKLRYGLVYESHLVVFLYFWGHVKVSLKSSTMSPPATESNKGICCCG